MNTPGIGGYSKIVTTPYWRLKHILPPLAFVRYYHWTVLAAKGCTNQDVILEDSALLFLCTAQ